MWPGRLGTRTTRRFGNLFPAWPWAGRPWEKWRAHTHIPNRYTSHWREKVDPVDFLRAKLKNQTKAWLGKPVARRMGSNAAQSKTPCWQLSQQGALGSDVRGVAFVKWTHHLEHEVRAQGFKLPEACQVTPLHLLQPFPQKSPKKTIRPLDTENEHCWQPPENCAIEKRKHSKGAPRKAKRPRGAEP